MRGDSLKRLTTGVTCLVVLGTWLTSIPASAKSTETSTSRHTAAQVAVPGRDGAAADQNRPPSKAVTQHERATMNAAGVDDVVRHAPPLPVPRHEPVIYGPSPAGAAEPEGPELRVDGVAVGSAVSGLGSASGSAPTATSTSQNGPWPGAYSEAPNRQIGVLVADSAPGPAVSLFVCSATVINSENKSTVLTAGHCVYNPDPDGNGLVEGNGYWHESFRFCPGYEYGCKLGKWNYREASTTASWYFGHHGTRLFDRRDDVGLLVMEPNENGNIVDIVGGQGIAFNARKGLYRHAFGYPYTDARWPQYSYDGLDAIYCPGKDSPQLERPGTISIPCTMTAGASGGPWLTNPNASWLGHVNSVNSFKPHGGARVAGPYFGNAERDLFQYWRAR